LTLPESGKKGGKKEGNRRKTRYLFFLFSGREKKGKEVARPAALTTMHTKRAWKGGENGRIRPFWLFAFWEKEKRRVFLFSRFI